MTGRMRVAIFYVLFAILATAANLGTQGLVHVVLPPVEGIDGAAYWVALGIGTTVGLLVKYLLDKRWIFFDSSVGLAAHGRRFSLYTLMGIATTAIFWGVQSVFFAFFGTQTMLYVGGAVGLAIGYLVKYHLDRRFVFSQKVEKVL